MGYTKQWNHQKNHQIKLPETTRKIMYKRRFSSHFPKINSFGWAVRWGRMSWGVKCPTIPPRCYTPRVNNISEKKFGVDGPRLDFGVVLNKLSQKHISFLQNLIENRRLQCKYIAYGWPIIKFEKKFWKMVPVLI